MSLFKKPHLLQGVYYLITGIWPLLHIQSFMAVSGPKEDLWLVKTVGVLVSIIGITLLLPLWFRKPLSKELTVMAVLSCVGFAAIDTYYALADRIWDVYLADALAQIILLFLYFLNRKRIG